MKTKVLLLHCLLFLICLLFASPLVAQDGFGFGFGDEVADGSSAGGGLGSFISGASIHGDAAAKLQFYGKDFESGDTFKDIRLGEIFSGALRFNASSSNAEGIINLNLIPNIEDPGNSFALDEAYVRAFFGGFTLLGGFKKLTWGKADSLGPLDVINPFDYSDLSEMSDLQSIKIARPLLHASYQIGNFSKVEGVFVPWFEGHRFALGDDNRWTARQYRELPDLMEGRIRRMFLEYFTLSQLRALSASGGSFGDEGMPEFKPPETYTLEYSQGGVRFTTTLGPADLGIQYYSGFLNRPAAGLNKRGIDTLRVAIADMAAKQNAFDAAESGYAQAQAAYNQAQGAVFNANAAYAMNPSPVTVAALADATQALADAGSAVQNAGTVYRLAGLALQRSGETLESAANTENLYTIQYNRFHQIGIDYAQVLFGFNIRSEFAATITSDLSGDDGLTYNPSLAWSVGFDRDLIWGINANLQINESIRLLHYALGTDPLYEAEAGAHPTSTRLTLHLSRTFLQDRLELKATTIWGMEDMDVYFIPGLTWTAGDLTIELSGGVFGGKDTKGELSQYHDNGFFRTLLTYSF